jgi:hypothetical protein
MPPEYEVTERTYSWGTVISLFKNGRRVMFVDVYNNGTWKVYEESSW